jgi:hypothetical protein
MRISIVVDKHMLDSSFFLAGDAKLDLDELNQVEPNQTQPDQGKA